EPLRVPGVRHPVEDLGLRVDRVGLFLGRDEVLEVVARLDMVGRVLAFLGLDDADGLREAAEALGNLLRVLAARVVLVLDDDDARAGEVVGELRLPLPRAATVAGRDEAALAVPPELVEGVGVLLPFAIPRDGRLAVASRQQEAGRDRQAVDEAAVGDALWGMGETSPRAPVDIHDVLGLMSRPREAIVGADYRSHPRGGSEGRDHIRVDAV